MVWSTMRRGKSTTVFMTASWGLLLGFLWLAPGAAQAQSTTGSLTGTVLGEKGEALPYASVLAIRIIDEKETTSDIGTPTNGAGEFTIDKLPAGRYKIRVLYMGYDTAEKVVDLNPGQTLNLQFSLLEVVANTVETVEVRGTEIQIRDDSQTAYTINAAELDKLPVDTFEEAVALQAGVTNQGGSLHFRGGRAGEVQYQIDGVPVSDPLVGGGVELSNASIADSDVLLGGFDAEYGNAQSGIINFTTQEGGKHFRGNVQYQTDDFGAPDKTYDNYDRLSFGFGGPTPVENLTYFVSAQGTWSDTFLKSSERRHTNYILDFISISDRQNNNIQLQGKLAWSPGSQYKLTFEVLDNRRTWDSYNHVFSQAGFIEAKEDTAYDTGDIQVLYGDYSEIQEGPNWIYYNAPEHTPNNTRDWRQYKAVWRHTVTEKSFYELKVSQNFFDRTASVGGKQPWEYDGRGRDFWFNGFTGKLEDYFATNGDNPFFLNRDTQTLNARGDWTAEVGRHRVKSGLSFIYNDMDQLSITRPNVPNADGTLGNPRSEFHYYNPEAAWYLQDRWEHEGMVVNAGIRWDMFSVGDQLGPSEVQDRVRSQWSPRLGIAYPVSDRDVFSFHYGWFNQIPDRQFIFENRTASVATLGNPNLDNETTISYQAALQHMFSDDVFGQFSVYFKDIFGLITNEEENVEGFVGPVNHYVNKDYASSRGFEVTLTKRFSQHFDGEISYSYGLATGVASDPNANPASQLYLPISEQPLDWDQRHSIGARLSVAERADWRANFAWSFGTGFPWTPWLQGQRQEDPLLRNSRRLPSEANLNAQAEKFYTIWDHRVKLFLRANNLLDSRVLQEIDPGQFPYPTKLVNRAYRTYYTETGLAGGAFLGEDLNEDGEDDWVPLHDPRVFSEGRSIRIGFGVDF